MNPLLKKILSCKVLVWDFDGCLCDSEPLHFLAYAKAFADCGHTLTESGYYENFTHTGAGVVKEIKDHGLSCDPELIRQKKGGYYWEIISAGRAFVYPEIPEILAITRRQGLLNVIASNSPNREIELILSQQKEKLAIDHVFGLQPGMQKKPAPDIYLKTLSTLGVRSTDVLVIEDSERGLLAAEQAKCEALWIKTQLNENLESRAACLARLTHAELLFVLKDCD